MYTGLFLSCKAIQMGLAVSAFSGHPRSRLPHHIPNMAFLVSLWLNNTIPLYSLLINLLRLNFSSRILVLLMHWLDFFISEGAVLCPVD